MEIKTNLQPEEKKTGGKKQTKKKTATLSDVTTSTQTDLLF